MFYEYMFKYIYNFVLTVFKWNIYYIYRNMRILINEELNRYAKVPLNAKSSFTSLWCILRVIKEIYFPRIKTE